MNNQAVLNAVGKVQDKEISLIPGNGVAFGTGLEKQEAVVCAPDLDALLGQNRDGS